MDNQNMILVMGLAFLVGLCTHSDLLFLPLLLYPDRI